MTTKKASLVQVGDMIKFSLAGPTGMDDIVTAVEEMPDGNILVTSYSGHQFNVESDHEFTMSSPEITELVQQFLASGNSS